ncbi:hypothetical protein HZB03_00065 [Candidatus Woesearchaeota archaeon]|nr:hypothetical protein [Candidatus Woesearchaeota archaeon]
MLVQTDKGGCPTAAIDPLALELQSDVRCAPIGRRTVSSIERSEILRGGLIREALPYGEVGPPCAQTYHELGVVVSEQGIEPCGAGTARLSRESHDS